MVQKKISIGTSGWYYEHWSGIFYGNDVSTEDRLIFYAEHFDTVEINNTFYKMPSQKTVASWVSKVPKQFIFSVKANRFLTHIKRLKNCEENVERLFASLAPFKKRLGPILFQLPPSFKKDLEVLNEFLNYLIKGYQYVFEFRHPTWFDEEVYELLKKSSIALCITDLKGHLSPEVVTGKFVYVRLHGPKAKAYKGEYGQEKLKIWQQKISNWAKKVKVYVYFDNDEKSYAVKDALALKKLITDTRINCKPSRLLR